MSTTFNRRDALLAGVALLGTHAAQAFPVCTNAKNQICNVTKLYSVQSSGIVIAKDADDIRRVLNSNHSQISVGGGRYSMGGQTAISHGIQIDMRAFNQLVWLDTKAKTARVQAGMRWRDLQTILDLHDLSVQTMQSYANFTVGGAVSVNCHGRYIGHGAVINSIRGLQLVLPDGQLLEVNRQQNVELFNAAIGGYGAVGIITEVELNLDDNFTIERTTMRVALADYPAWFGSQIASNKEVLLHNADLTPPHFDKPFCVTWTKTQKPLTVAARLTPEHRKYHKEKLAIWAMTEAPNGHKLRSSVQKMQQTNIVVWRNHEASLDVAELEPATRQIATYVLQEYFVPVTQFRAYTLDLTKLMQSMSTQTINISIRHSKADKQSLMPWAKEDCFCFVVYYKQRTVQSAELDVGRWTRAMIDLALKHNGRYYLPYQPHATQAQFELAYPEAGSLRRLRKELGASRLSNMMWARYKV